MLFWHIGTVGVKVVPYSQEWPGHTDRAQIRRYVLNIESRLREATTRELNGRLPVAELADEIEHQSRRLIEHIAR